MAGREGRPLRVVDQQAIIDEYNKARSDLRKAKADVVTKLRTPLLFLESYIGMLVIGGLHSQPDLHGLPALGYLATLGVRFLIHLVAPKRV